MRACREGLGRRRRSQGCGGVRDCACLSACLSIHWVLLRVSHLYICLTNVWCVHAVMNEWAMLYSRSGAQLDTDQGPTPP